jgi:hypothetical protein
MQSEPKIILRLAKRTTYNAWLGSSHRGIAALIGAAIWRAWSGLQLDYPIGQPSRICITKSALWHRHAVLA